MLRVSQSKNPDAASRQRIGLRARPDALITGVATLGTWVTQS